MSGAQAESVIKNIIREIVQECLGKGHVVSETLVAFMVKAVVLDPRNQFNVERTLTKQDVQKLIELCVDRLMDQQSPAVDTIKMQVYFDMHYTSRRELLEEHERVITSRLIPISREITDSRGKSREELEALYRRIVSYVLLRSGMGSITDINAVREATAALQSVFPQSELGIFMSHTKKDKQLQLDELSTIVAGIRLFNRHAQKGGAGIDDLPAILKEAIPGSTQRIESELQASQNLAYQYTGVLEHLLTTKARATECTMPLNLLKQALYNVRQHEAFLSTILADVKLCTRQVEGLQSDFSARMQELMATVHSNTAIPTAQVFPLFIALAKLWSGLQDELILLSVLSNTVTSLQPFLGAQSRLLPEDQLSILLEGVEVKSDEQRARKAADDHIDPSKFKNQEWLFPETTANFDKLCLQYRGICAYALIKDGLLLPGVPSLGILKHRNKYYSFSCQEAACAFASKPDESIKEVAEKAKLSPELIQLLELHHEFACVPPYSEMQSGERLLVKPILKCESSTQTDVHPLEPNIVKSYEWNEWELRRQAIRLANLRSKVTHSVQTNLSHMRRDNVTQTYVPKEAASQTKTDGKSNVPKPQVYLAGLRGGDGKRTHVIKTNLTRPVDE